MSDYIRKNLRLKDYNYNIAGYYFITICTENKEKIFGSIVNNKLIHSFLGILVEDSINNLKNIYQNIFIDKYVIMPNHIHMIIVINNETQNTVSNIIKNFKKGITQVLGKTIWQRSFYDHVIRNELDYLRIWQYIDNNPLKWNLDEFYY